jgi:phenylacetate-CoA ligase
MTVRIERATTSVDGGQMQSDVATVLKRSLGVRVDVEIVDPGTLSELTGYGESEGKVKRLLDLR